MKNQPDFDRPVALVCEILLSFPAGKPKSVKAIINRFHARYGKRCSREMVRRGMLALLDQHYPGSESAVEPLDEKLRSAQAE